MKSHKTNNHFSTAFHATRLRPLHLVDLDELEAELQQPDELENDHYARLDNDPPLPRQLRGRKAA